MRDKHEYMFADRTRMAGGRERTEVEKLAINLGIFSAFGEGMQLFSSFAILLSFKQRNLMKGMSTIVEWSIRDESLHVEAMIRTFHVLIEENPQIWTDELKQALYQTCREMVDLEDKFIDLAFGMGEIDGITVADTKQYIRYIADRRLLQLGLKPNYGVEENPFDWLDWLMNAPTHANFFEGRATEYTKSGVVNWDKGFERIDARTTMASPIALVANATKRADSDTETVVIYSKHGCPYCSLVKAELRQAGIPFDEIDLTDDKIRTAFYVNTSTNTVPQIYVTTDAYTQTRPSGRRIGGWSEVAPLLKAA